MSTLVTPPVRYPADNPPLASYTAEDALAGHWTQLSGTELLRRLWHMAPGLLPFVLWPFPHQDPLSWTTKALVFGTCAVLGSGVFFGYNLIRRSELDREQRAAVAGYLFSVVAMFLLFPGAAELGMAQVAILAFGDGSATLGGLYFGGRKLPWNRRKTWSGLACFIVVGTVMASLVYWGEARNLEALPIPGLPGGVTMPLAMACTGAAVVAAALAESIPSRINDNIRVGVVSAVVLVAMHHFLVGWHS